MPKLYQDIVDEAKDKDNIYEVLNIVTTNLAEKIQYLTNARTTKGRLIPQDLKQVEATRLGDCKDYSTAVVVILKQLGIDAKSAAV